VKVAILADFPLHAIPSLGEKFRRPGHYKSWFVPIAEAFAGMTDIDVHWIVLSSQFTTPTIVEWNRQTFHILPTVPRYRAWTFFARDRVALRHCLAEIQPEIVHGWGTEDVHGFAAVTSGLPHIVSMQGILSYYMLKNRMHPREYCLGLVELYVLRKAATISVESAWGRDVILCRNSRAHVELVEYGVKEHFFNVQWQPDPQKPVAIFIGSISPRKGIQDAIAAFRDPQLAHAELWIIGNKCGPWSEQLQHEASANVKWLGLLSPEEISERLSHAWCMVLPTRADTSPNVVKEARVIGLPVISTPNGGQTTYVQHGENGFLVEPGDISSLTRHTVELLENLDKTKAYGACHHEEHRAALNPMETARKFRSLYLAIANSAHQIV